MIRPIVSLLSLLAVLLVTACASLEDALPPQVSLADVRLLQPGILEQELEVDLLVRNPNNFDLPLEGMTFDLTLNGQHFAEGFTNESVTIPRLGQARVPVTASTSFLDIVQQVMGFARGGGKLDYEINGLAYLRGITTRTVPYQKSGRLQLLPEGGGSGTGSGINTLVPL